MSINMRGSIIGMIIYVPIVGFLACVGIRMTNLVGMNIRMIYLI